MFKRYRVIVGFLLLYFIIRLFNLTALPIFIDEAMYINWGRLFSQNPFGYVFISLTDGQQPLWTWLQGIAYWFNGGHWLVAGRMVSILSGAVTLVVLWLLGKECAGLLKRKSGLYEWLLPLMYIISPFALWYDRLAIKDSFLMMLAGLCILFSIRIGRQKTSEIRWEAVALAVVLGVALLTKSIAYFFVLLSFVSIWLLYLTKEKVKSVKDVFVQSIKFVTLYWKWLVFIGILAFVIQGVMYLSDNANQISRKNSEFLLTFSELMAFPVAMWQRNAYAVMTWFSGYYGWSVIATSMLGVYTLIRKKLWLALMLLMWIVVPIGFEMMVAKIFFARYTLFTFIPFSILVVIGLDDLLDWIKPNLGMVAYILLIVVFASEIMLTRDILLDVDHARLPFTERYQYIEDWSSGYGLEELADFLSIEYLEHYDRVIFVTEQETLISSGLSLMFADYDNYDIQLYFRNRHLPEVFPLDFEHDGVKTVYLFYQNQDIPSDWPIELKKELPQGFNQARMFKIFEYAEK